MLADHSTTATFSVVSDAIIARNNDMLAAQASSKVLVQKLQAQEPDMEAAILFACETRTPGFAFYAGRPLNVTRADADVVLEPAPGHGGAPLLVRLRLR